jgi:hypothetical protein
MQNIFSRISNPALRQGLIFGLIFGVAQIALGYFVSLGLFILLALYFVVALFAGRRASKQTGSLKMGVLAGFWTGLFSNLVTVIFTLFFLFTQTNLVVSNVKTAARQAGQPTNTINAITAGSVIESELILILIGLVVAVLFGLAGGALGGLMGRNRAAPPKDQYQEAMFEPPSTTTRQ